MDNRFIETVSVVERIRSEHPAGRKDNGYPKPFGDKAGTYGDQVPPGMNMDHRF